MNKTETLKIFMLLETAYPHAYREMSDQMVDATTALWQQMFSDTPVKSVQAAVMTHIANNKYAPTIAEIKDYIAKMSVLELPSAIEAWQSVKRAVQHGEYTQGGYDYTRAFNALPELVRRVVGDKSELQVYANMDSKEFDTFAQQRFIANYNKQAATQSEFKRLPGIVQDEAAKLAEKNAVPLAGLLEEAERRRLS
jgi:hypothetical protein